MAKKALGSLGRSVDPERSRAMKGNKNASRDNAADALKFYNKMVVTGKAKPFKLYKVDKL